MAKENTTQSENELQAQIEQLRQEISQIAKTIGNIGSDKINKVKGQAEQAYASAKHSGEEAVSQAKEKLNDMESQLCECVKNKPATSLAVAAGIGFVLAMLVRR